MASLAPLSPVCCRPRAAAQKPGGVAVSIVCGRQHRPLRSRADRPEVLEAARPSLVVRAAPVNTPDTPDAARDEPAALTGEDAAIFDVTAQSLTSWAQFTAVLATVLVIMYVVWISPDTGLAGPFVDGIEAAVGGDSTATIAALLVIFAVVHSGGAGLRKYAEPVIGERAYRVVFAGLSLPLATLAVFYFINHRYDGAHLWNVQGVPGIHALVWVITFISFFFLYPSTFNLLEVAAVDKPKVHLWETGIMRISRHPQAVGQALWCAAHTLWVGSSFALATSALLLAHHAFGVWHGDRRLADKYGDAFESVRARTSVMPFAAILDGRQVLPANYWREFLRAPYVTLTVATLGAYWAHPIMQSAAFHLSW